MIVQKFGGTSLADASQILAAGEIVRSSMDRRPVVVVSAMAGVTDRLMAASEAALRKDADRVEEILAGVETHHRQAIGELLPDEGSAETVSGALAANLKDARQLCRGMELLGEITPKSLDALMALGELTSTPVVADALRRRGIPAKMVDARTLILTDSRFGAANVRMDETRDRCRTLVPLVKEGTVPVIPGFVASDAEGRTTTLGRGGSDHTAAILGASLDAEEIQIWTDVAGIMTADPRVATRARLLPEISFEEAAELTRFGAKVLHPNAIQPAVDRGIPIVVRNTASPAEAGTVIRAKTDSPVGLRAIASKKGIPVITVTSSRMLLAQGFLAEMFAVFRAHGASVDLVATSEVSISVTLDTRERMKEIVEDLRRLAVVETSDDNAIICCVGSGLAGVSGIAGRLFSVLEDIRIRIVSFGAKGINMSLVVADDDADEVVRRLHRTFFEGAS